MKKHITIRVPLELPFWMNGIIGMGDDGHEYGFSDSRFTDGERIWNATTLYKAADEQGCVVFEFPLESFDATWNRYPSPMRIADFAYHARRVLMADIRIPILLGPCGNVLDGAHRIIKAMITGEESLPAKRLNFMPPHDDVEKREK